MPDIFVTQANDNGLGDTANTLSWAILKANTDAGDDRIVLQTNVTVTGVMKRLLNSNITLTGDDPATPAVENYSISGDNQFRPLFVKSGTIALENLQLVNGRAKGGNSGSGGGGAGMGGALFVYAGNVSVSGVTFSGNQAIGGNANQPNAGIPFGYGGGGGGMYGDARRVTAQAGGGLFGDSPTGTSPWLGGYGGTGNYGGFGGPAVIGGNGGFGGGAGGAIGPGTGGSGGFGGGGAGITGIGTGGVGGFGGGGGRLANGGYGGGGGGLGTTPNIGGFGGGNSIVNGFGGSGAGMGGAIFVRTGTLSIENSTFTGNSATGGTALGSNPGQGLGGAIFAMKRTTNTNGNNQGMPAAQPTVNLDNVTFTGSNAADDGNTPNPTPAEFPSGTDLNNDDLFGNTITRTVPPNVTFTAATQTGAENAGTLTLTAQLSKVLTEAVTVPFTLGGTATAGAGNDYTTPASPLTIPANSTTANITLTINDDTLDEADETIIVTMGNPSVLSGATITQGTTTVHTATITDNDAAPTLSVNDVTVNEAAGTAQFTVSLSAASGQAISVNYATADVTATAGNDYTTATGTLNFAAGETTKTIDVTITDDANNETDETFQINLTAPNNATLADAQGKGTITDNDIPGVTVSKTTATATEGGATDTYTLKLNTIPTNPVTVKLDTGNQLDPIADFTFAADATALDPQTVTITATDDTAVEGNHSAQINHSVTSADAKYAGVKVAAVTVALTDNDTGFSLSSATPSITEGDPANPTVTFTLTRSGDVSAAGTIDYEFAGTAEFDTDYTNIGGTSGATALTGTVTFAPGETEKTITVEILNDNELEGLETIQLLLANATGAISGSPLTFNLIDDEQPAQPSPPGPQPIATFAQPGGGGIPDGQAEPITFAPSGNGATRTFQIFNSGNANLELLDVALPPGFSFVNLSRRTIPGGQAALLEIAFTGTDPGLYTGDLIVKTNDPNAQFYNFSLLGIISEAAIGDDVFSEDATRQAITNCVSLIPTLPDLDFTQLPDPIAIAAVGGAGDDEITGQNGNDLLVGGSGNDRVLGQAGDDLILGSAIPMVSTDRDDDTLFGNTGRDRIGAAAGDDLVHAGRDGDFVHGGQGNDQLWGDRGDDWLSGDLGSDRVFGGTGNPDDPDPDGRDTLLGGDGNDLLNGNRGDDAVLGEAGDDTLHGGQGNDLLLGGDGSDRLFGDAGNDTLCGGTGADEIVLGRDHGVDTVLNFESGRDRFLLAGDLSFADLSFAVEAGNLAITSGEERLAIVAGVASLEAIDFAPLT